MGVGAISRVTVSYQPARPGAACADCQEPGSVQADKNDAEKTAQKIAAKELVDERTKSAADGQVVAEMQRRDTEVRTHESAHQAVGGALAGAPSFIYATGPDGHRYAVGGSVSVDTSSASTPEATIQKMSQVRRAALAPLDPSSADRAIAAQASQQLAAAQQELLQRQLAEVYGRAESTAPNSDANHSSEDSAASSGVRNAVNVHA